MSRPRRSGASVPRAPQRTCVACRRTGTKRGLVRLVRCSDTSVQVDLQGRQLGRGAYLCRSYSCWADGVGKGYLERALKVKLDREQKEDLVCSAASLGGMHDSD